MLPVSSPPSLPEQKAALRREALARRAAMGEAGRALAAATAAAHAPALLSPGSGRVVALFAPFRDEIDTAPLAALLWDAGVAVALPVVVTRDAPLVFRAWRPGDLLEPQGPYRIPTPGAHAPDLVPDDLMVPLAAFDRRGYRIGYGAGFYDRTLALLRAERSVRAFGYGFSCQEVAEVPAEPHDEPVDGMITETAAFLCGG
ncbi:5-formyltetrahydrofolate cyclo-ligase [Aquabacter cavernae]|uniref:5-formyltetrahydrofolate cyclo-ligase n=1 Tax=Aquabacter cavernae TaxID=2496029 RepID=UPI000F8E46BD|nr:5-formyltetrahydrofolate cyclo-ligase [Aquabacter cavernae]